LRKSFCAAIFCGYGSAVSVIIVIQDPVKPNKLFVRFFILSTRAKNIWQLKKFIERLKLQKYT